jgi:hypothetical protein
MLNAGNSQSSTNYAIVVPHGDADPWDIEALHVFDHMRTQFFERTIFDALDHTIAIHLLLLG